MDHDNESLLDESRNINGLLYVLAAACGLLMGADLLFHKKIHLQIEQWFGFYCWYAVATCVALVLVARVTGKLLRRQEDYYDR